MNYMKILLIYMAATLSLAVQSTTAPVETPVPTPEVIAEQQTTGGETAVPAETAVVIELVREATPAPTETPPPVPQITPNKKYHNLKKGDRGSEVKALQERLIELGYLPQGSADGSYGNQTYKAVRSFQQNNGLTRDGIAGKRTQTYLFENPDVNPAPNAEPTPAGTSETAQTPEETSIPPQTPEEIPEATPAAESKTPIEEPTEAPTEEPTEAPTEEPTEAPTEEPTEAPTEEPTEAPTEEPTEAPTEEPTEAPTEEPTEAPTEEPTAKPTEAPAPTPDRTAGAPVTSAPVTKAPKAQPTMAVEEIDPEELHFTEAAGNVAFNESGAPLSWMAMEDGVQVFRKPRLQQRGGRIRVSLDDLAECLEDWMLSVEGNSVVLETEKHTVALLSEDAGTVMTVDGIEAQVDAADFEFEEGHFIDAEFLAEAMGGEATWVEEENTLMLRIP